MKILHVMLLTILLPLLLSCQGERKAEPQTSKSDSLQPTRHLDSLTSVDTMESANILEERGGQIRNAWKAIKTNDERLYRESSNWFRFHPYQNDFMFYTMMMAYKNNSPSAHFDVYRFYNRGTGLAKQKDTVFLNFILYNLARANELGYEIGNCEIDGISFNKTTIKSSGFYLKKMPHKLN